MINTPAWTYLKMIKTMKKPALPVSASALKKRLREYSDRKKALLLQRFFKTGPGGYAQGDIFIGVMVPYTRKVVKEFRDISLKETEKLLHSPVHEDRLAALLIMVSKFRSDREAERKRIYRLYLKNHAFINNWDLIDLTAPHIIGGFLSGKDRKVLFSLARSESMWKRRMSVLATFYFIRDNDFCDSIKIAEMLLDDREDLIHKAVGWMLREVGKRREHLLEVFLDKHVNVMPRTMLRYAIERLPEAKRKAYLNIGKNRRA